MWFSLLSSLQGGLADTTLQHNDGQPVAHPAIEDYILEDSVSASRGSGYTCPEPAEAVRRGGQKPPYGKSLTVMNYVKLNNLYPLTKHTSARYSPSTGDLTQPPVSFSIILLQYFVIIPARNYYR
jgi:hypothetical protein